VYWLCKDKTFYTEGLQILKSRQLFDPTFWSYSLLHKDLDTMREYFSCAFLGLKSTLGPQFSSSLITVNDREESQDLFNFLDYHPLISARAHRMGGINTDNTSRS
jgi:hypothetical protein